jgi:hypothetical protein
VEETVKFTTHWSLLFVHLTAYYIYINSKFCFNLKQRSVLHTSESLHAKLWIIQENVKNKQNMTFKKKKQVFYDDVEIWWISCLITCIGLRKINNFKCILLYIHFLKSFCISTIFYKCVFHLLLSIFLIRFLYMAWSSLVSHIGLYKS